ncbi:hypothetical protein D9M09_12170 [Janthinobacterium agaricidamnosum]|uniref:Uncharacterized protein n=1 Tax=Janthinobacterium agaricidamnosum TaxID=55508 RepID=A0A3G2E8Y6_9BURK|nr:hypothetical protein D9M09_12170 [Janthinobacterium agaricidamnosum]
MPQQRHQGSLDGVLKRILADADATVSAMAVQCDGARLKLQLPAAEDVSLLSCQRQQRRVDWHQGEMLCVLVPVGRHLAGEILGQALNAGQARPATVIETPYHVDKLKQRVSPGYP